MRDRKQVQYIEPSNHPEAELLTQMLHEIRTTRYRTTPTPALMAIASYYAHAAEIEGLNRDYRAGKRVEPRVGGRATPPGGWDAPRGLAGGEEGGGSK